jgi:DedD protein
LQVGSVKERLTGAVILAALIVLLVPELLTGPVRSAPRKSAATAVASEEAPLHRYTISLADDTRAHMPARTAPAEVPAPPPATAPAAHGSAAVEGGLPDTTDEPASAPAASTPAAAPAPAPAGATAPAAAAGASGAWMVQLGSFASHDNAERLAKQLRASGFQVSVSQGTTGRRLYRVRAGPTQDRAAAEQLAGKLRAQGHAGAVVPD